MLMFPVGMVECRGIRWIDGLEHRLGWLQGCLLWKRTLSIGQYTVESEIILEKKRSKTIDLEYTMINKDITRMDTYL